MSLGEFNTFYINVPSSATSKIFFIYEHEYERRRLERKLKAFDSIISVTAGMWLLVWINNMITTVLP